MEKVDQFQLWGNLNKTVSSNKLRNSPHVVDSNSLLDSSSDSWGSHIALLVSVVQQSVKEAAVISDSRALCQSSVIFPPIKGSVLMLQSLSYVALKSSPKT